MDKKESLNWRGFLFTLFLTFCYKNIFDKKNLTNLKWNRVQEFERK